MPRWLLVAMLVAFPVGLLAGWVLSGSRTRATPDQAPPTPSPAPAVQVTGQDYTFAAAAVEWLPADREQALPGTIAAALEGKPGLWVGPAASGQPTRHLASAGANEMAEVRWSADGRALICVVPCAEHTVHHPDLGMDTIEPVVDRPLQNWSSGDLAVLDVEADRLRVVDSTGRLDVGGLAARQPEEGAIIGGVCRGTEGVLLIDTDTGTVVQKLLDRGDVPGGGLDVSPDGKLCVISAEGGALEMGDHDLVAYSLPDGAEAFRDDEPNGGASGSEGEAGGGAAPAFSPDGRFLACVRLPSEANGQDSQVTVVSVSDPTHRDRFAITGWAGWTLSWSPDGRYLAIPSNHNAAAHLWLIDLAEKRLWKWLAGVRTFDWGP